MQNASWPAQNDVSINEHHPQAKQIVFDHTKHAFRTVGVRTSLLVYPRYSSLHTDRSIQLTQVMTELEKTQSKTERLQSGQIINLLLEAPTIISTS